MNAGPRGERHRAAPRAPGGRRRPVHRSLPWQLRAARRIPARAPSQPSSASARSSSPGPQSWPVDARCMARPSVRIATARGACRLAVADLRADGQATSVTGVAMMVVSADCLPVAVAGQGAVAMLHCGWRGLAAGVLEEGVAGACRSWPGPGRCRRSSAREPDPAATRSGRRCTRPSGCPARTALLDLPGVARSRLVAAGVEEVLTVGLCTICDARFYSHRREGARAGRQAGIAWLS